MTTRPPNHLPAERTGRTSGRVPQLRSDGVKIFVTVGTELPFDRLVAAVDGWADRRNCAHQVVAQIGSGGRPPRAIAWQEMFDRTEFNELFDRADLIVAHAGMGTILRALEQERPLIVVPRRAALGEHRNDHQLATVERLGRLGLVNAACDASDLLDHLDRNDTARAVARIGPYADETLIRALRDAITTSTP